MTAEQIPTRYRLTLEDGTRVNATTRYRYAAIHAGWAICGATPAEALAAARQFGATDAVVVDLHLIQVVR